jgi:HupE / UreJ protein
MSARLATSRRGLLLTLALLLGSGAGVDARAHGPAYAPPTQASSAPPAATAVDIADRPAVLRAVDSLQYAHQFAAAERLISRRLAFEPDDGAALVQRSQLRIALHDYRGALADCVRASRDLDALTASACQAQAEGALGRVREARRLVETALARAAERPPADAAAPDDPAQSLGWAQGIAAELAARDGDPDAAEIWHHAAIAHAGAGHFPRLAYAQFLLERQRPRAALDLLADAGDSASVVDLRRLALQAMAATPIGGGREAPRPAGVTPLETTGATAFFVLGIEHLLDGYDHLAFLALLLLGTVGARGSLRDAARVVTAFTVAHSLTLALALSGRVRVPAAAVEATIAASIVVMAVLLVRAVLRRRPTATGHWGLAFGFGLVHGLGFANVLVELLQGSSLAGALVAFNLGLESAQLGLVLVSLPAILWLARHPALARPAIAVLAAGIGLLGCGWLGERLA